MLLVALRKESVDRNICFWLFGLLSMAVALRKESVDRNFLGGRNRKLILMSLSARRAWIEISEDWLNAGCLPSLSARRAWIEMIFRLFRLSLQRCRSPQGERG